MVQLDDLLIYPSIFNQEFITYQVVKIKVHSLPSQSLEHGKMASMKLVMGQAKAALKSNSRGIQLSGR